MLKTSVSALNPSKNTQKNWLKLWRAGFRNLSAIRHRRIAHHALLAARLFAGAHQSCEVHAPSASPYVTQGHQTAPRRYSPYPGAVTPCDPVGVGRVTP